MKLDNRKRYLTVLDTETTGLNDIPGLAFPLIYDIGWKLADKNGNTIMDREFIVQEIFYNPIMSNAFYGSKVEQYKKRIFKADILVKPFKEILSLLVHDISLVKHNTLMAYNLNFDLRAIRSTMVFLKLWNKEEKDIKKFFPETLQYQDIWGLAVETLLLKKWDYLDFVEEHGFLTDAGNPKTSAEIVYRYITNDPGYIEHHTALEDVQIEYEIAIKSLATKKAYTKGILVNPWQIVSKLYKEYIGA